MKTVAQPKVNILLYDGQCPFCNNLVQYWQLQNKVDNLALKNAREEPELVEHYRELGYSINDGIIFDWDGTIYFGDRAIYIVSSLTKHKNLSKLLVILFRNRMSANILYSTMKLGRLFTLKLLGRKDVD